VLLENIVQHTRQVQSHLGLAKMNLIEASKSPALHGHGGDDPHVLIIGEMLVEQYQLESRTGQVADFMNTSHDHNAKFKQLKTNIMEHTANFPKLDHTTIAHNEKATRLHKEKDWLVARWSELMKHQREHNHKAVQLNKEKIQLDGMWNQHMQKNQQLEAQSTLVLEEKRHLEAQASRLKNVITASEVSRSSNKRKFTEASDNLPTYVRSANSNTIVI
jgi:chromosome segregation ATPase